MANISGWVKPDILNWGGPKMAKMEHGAKPDIFKNNQNKITLKNKS